MIKYSKDFVIFSSFFIVFFGSKKDFFSTELKTTFLDKTIILFIMLSSIYAIIPIGEASFYVKLIYLKNIYLIGVVYYLGRNFFVNENLFFNLKKIFISILCIAFLVSSIEYLFNFHLHSFFNYAKFNLLINDILPEGNFGLSWTFERSPDQPRFGSIFPNPLEFSSNLILFLTIPLFAILHSKKNIYKNLLIILIVFVSFYYAYSRASILSALIVIFAALLITKNYRTVFYILVLLLFSILIFYFSASEDSIYFIIDTFTFNESSSFSHLIEWIQAILTIIENPLGIGLAMSGNASGVDQAIKIGGENQFLIYGVQMGVISMILYSIMLFKSIRDSFSVFSQSKGYIKELAFIVLLAKFGLIIPLLTANAELYLFVSLTTWFLIGSIQRSYQKIYQ
ncbi:MAG: O-antigen ligase family protein [Flavobacteriaceae bacterium]|nr:O-antigen ligase family protein [Flavobacteriaceae bacterium]